VKQLDMDSQMASIIEIPDLDARNDRWRRVLAGYIGDVAYILNNRSNSVENWLYSIDSV
jgi:hypothetical protein